MLLAITLLPACLNKQDDTNNSPPNEPSVESGEDDILEPARNPSPSPQNTGDHDQLIRIRKGNKYGAVNMSGELVYSTEYMTLYRVGASSCYMLRDCRTGSESYAIGDNNGELLTDYEFTNYRINDNGSLLYLTNSTWFENDNSDFFVFDTESRSIILTWENRSNTLEFNDFCTADDTFLMRKTTDTGYGVLELYNVDSLIPGDKVPIGSFEADYAQRVLNKPYYILTREGSVQEPDNVSVIDTLGNTIIPFGIFEYIVPADDGTYIAISGDEQVYLNENLELYPNLPYETRRGFFGDYGYELDLYDKIQIISKDGAPVGESFFGTVQKGSTFWLCKENASDYIIVLYPNDSPRKLSLSAIGGLPDGFDDAIITQTNIMGNLIELNIRSEYSGSLNFLLNPHEFRLITEPGKYSYIENWRYDSYNGTQIVNLEYIFGVRRAYKNSSAMIYDIFTADGQMIAEGAKDVVSITESAISYIKGFNMIVSTWDGGLIYSAPIFDSID